MFAKAMNSNTYTSTWNGANSLATPDLSGQYTGRLSLFFKAIRGVSDEKLYEYFEKSITEDVIDTFVIAFNIRDIRAGKGERSIGNTMMTFLAMNHQEKFLKVLHLIPEYGRWQDILCFFPKVTPGINSEVSEHVVDIVCKQIIRDLSDMNDGKPISLAAKWMPTENDSMDKRFHLVNVICKKLNITPKQYRTEYIGPLRKYLNIVERLMCQKRWGDIDFSKVPSCAMKKLKKAFEKNTPDFFNGWKISLSKGEVKINAKVLFPHEIIREIRMKCGNNEEDQVLISQWEVMEDEVRKLGILQKSLVIVDNSGSMTDNNNLPADIAFAMGILISSIVEGDFHNNVISFHDEPTFFELKDGNIYEKYAQIKNSPVGYSTNLQKTFDLILRKAKECKLKQEDMPDKVFIISDMQYNSIETSVEYGCGYGRKNNTNFEEIEEKYLNSGYKRPKIYFWNVNGNIDDFPVSVDDNGTCMISGASPSILKSVFKSGEVSPVQILREVLDDDRYQDIRRCLE
jgi:hypothetical protein